MKTYLKRLRTHLNKFKKFYNEGGIQDEGLWHYLANYVDADEFEFALAHAADAAEKFPAFMKYVEGLEKAKADLINLAQTCYIDLRLDEHYDEASERATNLIKQLREDLDGYGVDAEAAFKKWMDEDDPGWDDPGDEEEPDHSIHYGDGRDFDDPYPPEDDPSYLT